MFNETYYKSYTKGTLTWDQTYCKRAHFYRLMCRALLRIRPQLQDMIEIGCGLGMFSYTMASSVPNLSIRTGDISEYAMSVTKEILSMFPSVSIQRFDAENLPFKNETADIVVAFDVAEHLEHPERLIQHAFRVLRPNGLFLMTTPNPQSFGARIKEGKEFSTGNGYLGPSMTWFGWRDDSHINIRSIDAWRKNCLEAGFVKIQDGTDALWDTPYYRGIPLILQKLIFNGSYHILMRWFATLSWQLGENYIGFWRKP